MATKESVSYQEMAGQLNSVYLLTEWEGWTAKCLVRAHEIQTEDNKVCMTILTHWSPLSLFFKFCCSFD